MPNPAIPQNLRAGALITDVARALRVALDRQFEELGLTTQQAAVLRHLSNGEEKATRIAELVGTNTAGMTRLIDRLETKSLVERRRHTTDRRAQLIALTAAGARILPRVGPVFGQVAARLTATIAPEALDATVKVLERMLANLATTEDQPAGVATTVVLLQGSRRARKPK